MKKITLAATLAALAGIALGQNVAGTMPFFDIARWLGTYNRADLTQTTVWTYGEGGSSTSELRGFEVTDLIEVVGFEGEYLAVCRKAGTQVGQPLWKGTFVGNMRIDPEMFGHSPIMVAVMPELVDNSGSGYGNRRAGYIAYRTR